MRQRPLWSVEPPLSTGERMSVNDGLGGAFGISQASIYPFPAFRGACRRLLAARFPHQDHHSKNSAGDCGHAGQCFVDRQKVGDSSVKRKHPRCPLDAGSRARRDPVQALRAKGDY
jgi:hypothetical protein